MTDTTASAVVRHLATDTDDAFPARSYNRRELGRLAAVFGVGAVAASIARPALAVSKKSATTLPSGLIFDLDPDKIPSQADNTNLLSWRDVIGGVTFTNPSGTLKYRAAGGAGLGGHAYVTGADVYNSYVQCAYAGLGPLAKAILSGEYTVVAVLDKVGVNSMAQCFGAYGGNFNLIADGTKLGFYAASGGYMPWASGTDYTGSNGYVSFGCTSTLHNRSQNNVSFRPYFRGLPQAETGQRGPSTRALPFAVGAQEGGAERFIGNMYRFLVWPRELSPDEMLQVEFYLNTQYRQTHPIFTLGKAMIFDGDSRTANFAGGPAPAQYLSHRVAAGLSPKFPVGTYANFAVPHLNIAGCIAKAPYETDVLPQWFPNVAMRLYYEEFFNSASLPVGSVSDFGTTADTLAGQTYQYWAARKAAFGANSKFVGGTPYSYGTLYGSATVASAWGTFLGAGNAIDGTTGANNWQNMDWNGENLLDGLSDMWADPIMGGIDAAATNPTYWAEGGTGQLHANATGQQWQAGWTATGIAGASGSPFGVIQAMNAVDSW